MKKIIKVIIASLVVIIFGVITNAFDYTVDAVKYSCAEKAYYNTSLKDSSVSEPAPISLVKDLFYDEKDAKAQLSECAKAVLEHKNWVKICNFFNEDFESNVRKNIDYSGYYNDIWS